MGNERKTPNYESMEESALVHTTVSRLAAPKKEDSKLKELNLTRPSSIAI